VGAARALLDIAKYRALALVSADSTGKMNALRKINDKSRKNIQHDSLSSLSKVHK
jgi:hypothetical protein